MTLQQWAQRWGVPVQAMSELSLVLQEPVVSQVKGGKSENFVAQQAQLDATKEGCRLWRNNVGMLMNEDGVPVRYGLCNESSKINKKTKSSDFIGATPVVITQAHVGQTLGVFTAIETKKQGWKYSGNDHEKGQLNFLNIVASLGGIAAFINDANQFTGVINHVRKT